MQHRHTEFILKREVEKLNNISKEDLLLINKYTRKELTENDVYTFSVNLCDNDVDRDYEAFSKDALKGLAPLFLGKTGIFDHNPTAKNQSARIYKTWCEEDAGRKTVFGENYFSLKAKAYILKTEKNKSLIDEIEGGIKKEVSVSCNMKSTVCSVCGKDIRLGACEHRKGRTYGGKLCYGILSGAEDAYEWSFVAVPAQRNAGVTKSFLRKVNMENTIDIIKSANDDITLSKGEVLSLKSYIAELEEMKEEALCYRKSLQADIEKYALIVMPFAAEKSLLKGFENLGIKDLEEVRKGLKKQAEEVLPPTVQLKSLNHTKTTDNNSYTI